MACTYIYQGKKYNAWEFADVLASMPIDDLMKYIPGAVAAQLSEATQASRLGYDVQARKKAYTDDRQLQLFLDSEPDPSQTGPASDRARREAVAVVDDLRSTGDVLAQALSSDYAVRQRTNLVGQKITSAEDLAILAQVYRDPRFETFRVIFTDDNGGVVSQVGLTSRLPASATAIIGNDADAYLRDLSDAAKKTGATGFYLLHNHPSGLAKPSSADIALTTTFAEKMPGMEFKSHIVIDTNEYSTIDGNGQVETLKKDFLQPSPYRVEEWANTKIDAPSVAMDMAKRLQVDDGAITLIHVDTQLGVKSITTIPESVALGERLTLRRQVTRASLSANGSEVFAVGRSRDALSRLGGMVVDSLLVGDNGSVTSLRVIGEIGGGKLYPANRVPRLSPDSSRAFDYLKRTPKGVSAAKVGESESRYAETLPDTITINGVERPTRNSNGQPISVGVFDKDGNRIGSAEEGIRNSDEQRRNQSPESTQDVANSNVIVVMNGTEMAMAPANADAPVQKSTVSASRDRLIEAFGKSLVTQLENIGLLNIAQTELEAIDRAAQMYAEATGQPIEDVRNSMLASIRASRAWHGSPYKFDKFSTEHIGTGEGASRYGWGLYFTDKKEIAEHYRSALTDAKYYVYGVEFEVNDPVVEKILFDNADDLYRAAGLLESYSKDNKAASEEISSLLVAISDNSLKVDVGSLYEVEITGDDVFLLWDSPISEQPDAVRTAIMSMPSASDINLPDSATGEQFYEALVKLWQDDNGIDRYEAKAEASLDLNEAGVKGIKYLDGQSRSAGEGNFNYVVFDDADVQIIDVKYSADGKIQGFYVPGLGKSYLIADNVSANDMPAVMVHEIGVHAATDSTDKRIAEKMQALNQRAADLLENETGEFFDRVNQRLADAGETSNEEKAAYLLEEARKAKDSAPPASVRQWLKDVVAALKAWMFRNGMLGAGRLNQDDMLAVVEAYMKQVAGVRGNGDAKYSMIRVNVPDAIIANPLGDAASDPNHDKAKAGDSIAGMRLALKLVTPDLIEQLRGIENPIVLGVVSVEATGRNKIPDAAATLIAKALGAEKANGITQSSSPKRTQIDGLGRIFNRPEFSGVVEAGRNYIMVDDTITQGGTFASLAQHIEAGGGNVAAAIALTGKQYSRIITPSEQTLAKLREIHGDLENEFRKATGYGFDGLTESEARYLANFKPAKSVRDRIASLGAAARQQDVGSDAQGSGLVAPDGSVSKEIRFSRSSQSSAPAQVQRPALPAETKSRAFQRKMQDKLNRFTVIKEWLAEQGIELSELADVHKAEERMHSRFANKAEDFREKRVKPLVEKIQKAGFSMDDVARFLHAQHAKERNDQIAKINKNLPDGGSGMTNAEAAAILAASSPELAALANELRSITVDTKNILLNSGLISKEMADAWDGAYQHYVPLKGGPDDEAGGKGTGKGLSVREKQRRALGHEKREDDTREDGEWIIENILADHERALMQAEKNRVFQSLLKMAVETSPLDLVTINRPEKRQILKNQASYVVRVKGRPVDSFTTKEAANLFKQSVALSQKGVSPADITIEKTYDQTVALMASPMPGPNEATGYINGQLVRVQFNDDLLARAYNNMGAESLGNILKAGRALNNYFSKIYTGYNPEFLLVNVIRDFQTGLMNTTGEEGIGMAMKAAKNYTMRFIELFRYARTGNETQWIKMYREDGGNTGAAYLSDLERLGSEIQTEYKAFQGVAANLQKGDYKGAARAAMRKVFDKTLVYIEHVNQAGENAMRLAVYQAMIESGRSRREAASLAKNVTVNFNRKGEFGAQANALYLFFNASVQGTAAVAHAHFKGKHRMQAWGFSSAILGMGYLLSLLAAEADEEEYEKTSEYERSRNILIPTGDGFFKIPVAFGYGFFWNFGRGMADAQRTGDLGKTPWHIASSFVEEFTPFGATMAGDGPDSEQAMLYSMPTVAQIVGAPVFNRTSMGIQMMPSSFSEYAHARDLMNRNTRGTWADDLAGLLEDVGMDVSPETLKHYGRTFTGGSGMFASSVVDGAKLKWEGAELEASEIPFFRKLYTVPDVRGARARYYEAKSEAEKALADFKRAVKQGDMETANEIQAEQGELLALARLAANQKKRIKAARDRIDSIRLSGEYGKAAERHIIKNLEAEEAQIYDNYMAIFKARMGR